MNKSINLFFEGTDSIEKVLNKYLQDDIKNE